MAANLTGKQRAIRIPLDYYTHRDALGRWKLGLALLAPVLALAWWFGGNAGSRGQQGLRASHGPVAAAHATWERQCEACHTPFQAIGTEPPHPLIASWVGPATNAKCQACHPGPLHHENQIPREASCTSCHGDHRGRGASLVRSPDRHCTICHGDLKAHTRKGASRVEPIPAGVPDTGTPGENVVYGSRPFADVHSFHGDHPDFAVPVEGRGFVRLGDKPVDPSHLKFNHAVHMALGMRQGFTLAQISDPADRQRYRYQVQDGTEVIQLQCHSCHVLDPGDFPGLSPGGATVRQPLGRGEPGAYMMPIVYENQCRACHPLNVSRPGAGSVMPAAKGQGQPDKEPPPLTVPHGVQPAELHKNLSDAVAAQILTSKPERLRRRRMPGQDDVEAPLVREEIEQAVLQAEQILYMDKQTCTECHDYTALKPGQTIQFQKGAPPNFMVQAPRVPDVWFVHAVFDHSAHRAVNCRACHEPAYATDAGDAENPAGTSETVMLPRIETCRKCHAPPARDAGQVHGGARYDCVECHRYHNGDHPRQGVGALAQGAKDEDKGTIAEFLNLTGPFARAGAASVRAPATAAPGSP